MKRDKLQDVRCCNTLQEKFLEFRIHGMRKTIKNGLNSPEAPPIFSSLPSGPKSAQVWEEERRTVCLLLRLQGETVTTLSRKIIKTGPSGITSEVVNTQ